MKVVTRFAPSPTGFLHIGGARTAIFNYLFAKHYGGEFLLRIEDTDQQRSTLEAIDAIFNGLKWLNLDYDRDVVFQSKNCKRHEEIANDLLLRGKAYKCFMTQEEIDMQRQKAIADSSSFLLKSPWRDADPASYPDKAFVIRIKAPHLDSYTIADMVQGNVTVNTSVLDDFVLLRNDATPTYMLAVVVDDHDMGITHIIRGDDHLNNAFRQKLIYDAMGWDVPHMAHIPLIHGDDGTKLSKRHGALGVEAYRDMGYLPDAIFNYLLRLGWSHHDDEVISKLDAIKWFDGTHIGKAPSRIDFAKMKHINSLYIRNLQEEDAIRIIKENWDNQIGELSEIALDNIKKALPEILIRSDYTCDLVELAKIYHPDSQIMLAEEALEIVNGADKVLLKEIYDLIGNLPELQKDSIQSALKAFAESKMMRIGDVMKPIRAILTGRAASPSVFEIIAIVGKDTSLKRLAPYAC